jgi:hypothetical protein
VSLRRRRELPADLQPAFDAFARVLDEVEPAKAALTEVMPTTRLPGRSLPDALSEFEQRLTSAKDGMASWHIDAVDDVWLACDAGIDESVSRAERLRAGAPDLGGFEGLLWAVGELMAPLEPFEEADRRFRALRAGRRSRR